MKVSSPMGDLHSLFGSSQNGANPMLDRLARARRLSVAPMMDWTDRHCRFFHRLLSGNALLYTEMITTGALLHGNVERHLDYSLEESPVVLQLGGSEPGDLAQVAKLAQQWGYSEINLNCGCPSERVQRGAFGACLMAEPVLVADCVKAMLDAVSLPISVKHRIGIDKEESYDFVSDFVGTLADAGCQVFLVHARNAWLKGLSPKQNREVPPLRYDLVYRLKQDFPQLHISINGGINSDLQVLAHLDHVDGVMIGREAYHNPWWLAQWDETFFNDTQIQPAKTRESVEASLVNYMQAQAEFGVNWYSIARHMLGLRNGLPGARHWRQVWSNHKLKGLNPAEVSDLAHVR
jgi:tRNA-dihydrouridine synthase A